jgi:excisionase family DNA binding protein
MKDKLLNRKEVAELLGIKPETLAVWSCTKRYNIPYIKVGRMVRYKYEDVEAFLNSRKQEK